MVSQIDFKVVHLVHASQHLAVSSDLQVSNTCQACYCVTCLKLRMRYTVIPHSKSPENVYQLLQHE